MVSPGGNVSGSRQTGGGQADLLDHVDEGELEAALRRPLPTSRLLEPLLHAADARLAGLADRREVLVGLLGGDEVLVPHVLSGALEAVLTEVSRQPEQHPQGCCHAQAVRALLDVAALVDPAREHDAMRRRKGRPPRLGDRHLHGVREHPAQAVQETGRGPAQEGPLAGARCSARAEPSRSRWVPAGAYTPRWMPHDHARCTARSRAEDVTPSAASCRAPMPPVLAGEQLDDVLPVHHMGDGCSGVAGRETPFA
jgi:hypothetical protein